MRVWSIADGLWVAGDTLLRAVRAAAPQLGYGFRELVETIDGEVFHEIRDWQGSPVYCADRPDAMDLTLGDVLTAPGVAMSTEDWH